MFAKNISNVKQIAIFITEGIMGSNLLVAIFVNKIM